MAAVGGVLKSVGGKLLGAMTKAGGAIKNVATKAKGGLLNLGNKVKDAGVSVGNRIKNVTTNAAKNVKNAGSNVATKARGVKTNVLNSKPITNMRTGVSNFKTNLKAGYNNAYAKYSNSFAQTPPKDVGTGTTQTGKAGGAGGQAYRNEITRGSAIAHAVAGIAMAGVAAYQVKSSNKQYKDAAAREDAYNKALQAKTDEADAEKAKTTSEYNARTDAYNEALMKSSTQNDNIYSSGYAGDSIFSSPLKNPKYTLI